MEGEIISLGKVVKEQGPRTGQTGDGIGTAKGFVVGQLTRGQMRIRWSAEERLSRWSGVYFVKVEEEVKKRTIIMSWVPIS